MQFLMIKRQLRSKAGSPSVFEGMMSTASAASVVLGSLSLVAALGLGRAAQAQNTPVTVTITSVEQIGDGFDLTTRGDFYARITINGSIQTTFNHRFSF